MHGQCYPVFDQQCFPCSDIQYKKLLHPAKLINIILRAIRDSDTVLPTVDSHSWILALYCYLLSIIWNTHWNNRIILKLPFKTSHLFPLFVNISGPARLFPNWCQTSAFGYRPRIHRHNVWHSCCYAENANCTVEWFRPSKKGPLRALCLVLLDTIIVLLCLLLLTPIILILPVIAIVWIPAVCCGDCDCDNDDGCEDAWRWRWLLLFTGPVEQRTFPFGDHTVGAVDHLPLPSWLRNIGVLGYVCGLYNCIHDKECLRNMMRLRASWCWVYVTFLL